MEGLVNWTDFAAALLELVGRRVTVDIRVVRTPLTILGLQGVLVNVTEGVAEEDPTEQVSLNLRIQPAGAEDWTYLHVLQPWFVGAEWSTIGGKRALCVSFRDLQAMIVPDPE